MKALRSLAAQLRRSHRDVLFKTRTTSATAVASADVLVKDVKPFDAVPGPTGICNLPIIGPMFHFKPFTKYESSRLNELADHLQEIYGPVVKVNLGKWLVFVDDPADMETIFRNEGRFPERPLPAIHRQYCKDRGLNPGVGSLQDEEWYNLRRALNTKLMMPSSPLHYLHAQNGVADDLLKKITENHYGPEEMKTEFFKYAAESISVVVYNKRLGLLDDDFESNAEKSEFFKQMQILFDLFSRYFHAEPLFLGLFETRMYKEYAKCFGYIVERVVVDLKNALDVLKQMEKDGAIDPDEPNFLLSLISTGKFSPGEVQTIVLDLFVAGTESTAQNLQIFLYHLARHPDKQQELYKEIQSVVGTSGPLMAEHMVKLVYLKACLKESFRVIHPTASGTGRFIPKDLVLGGYNIPAGTLVVMNNQRTVMNEKYFPKPKEFLPERWLRDEKGNRARYIPPMAHLPFGFGPRNCLGRRFAEQEIYLAVSKEALLTIRRRQRILKTGPVESFLTTGYGVIEQMEVVKQNPLWKRVRMDPFPKRSLRYDRRKQMIIQKFHIELEPDQEDLEVEYYTFARPKHPIKFKFTQR